MAACYLTSWRWRVYTLTVGSYPEHNETIFLCSVGSTPNVTPNATFLIQGQLTCSQIHIVLDRDYTSRQPVSTVLVPLTSD